MKKYLVIKDEDNNIVFKGKPIALPIKETAITAVCIELFDDPEPCVIHASYATQTIIDRFLQTIDSPLLKDYPLATIKDLSTWLDLDNLEHLHLFIEVKK